MSTFLGKEGAVYIGTNAVAEVRDFSVETTAETVDATVMGSTGDWMVKKATQKSWTASINCYYDSSDTNGQLAMDEGSEVAVKLYPEGNTTGNKYYYGQLVITSISRSASFDGLVEISFSGDGNGPLTEDAAS
jgi:predicted secreted protein